MAESRPPAPPAPDPPTEPSSLPVQRAFVVQLRADADPARGVVRGRIEHMISGSVARFESAEELIACLRDALTLRARTSSRPPRQPLASETPPAPRQPPRRTS